MMKVPTSNKRREKRKKKQEEAQKLEKIGLTFQAHRKRLESVEISAEMVYAVKTRLREHFGPDEVQCIVAPYEADPQMAYLSRSNYVDVLISEDSDLLLFGAHRVLFKLNNSWEGDLIDGRDVLKSEFLKGGGYTRNKFLEMCILSGCDYLPSPKGIGLKTANTLCQKKLNMDDIFTQLDKKISKEYIETFSKAFLVFKYASVFCPYRNEVVYLNKFPLNLKPIFRKRNLFSNEEENKFFKTKTIIEEESSNIDDKKYFEKILKKSPNLDFLGVRLSGDKARALANCQIDPRTKKEFLKTYLGRMNFTKRISEPKKQQSPTIKTMFLSFQTDKNKSIQAKPHRSMDKNMINKKLKEIEKNPFLNSLKSFQMSEQEFDYFSLLESNSIEGEIAGSKKNENTDLFESIDLEKVKVIEKRKIISEEEGICSDTKNTLIQIFSKKEKKESSQDLDNMETQNLFSIPVFTDRYEREKSRIKKYISKNVDTDNIWLILKEKRSKGKTFDEFLDDLYPGCVTKEDLPKTESFHFEKICKQDKKKIVSESENSSIYLENTPMSYSQYIKKNDEKELEYLKFEECSKKSSHMDVTELQKYSQ